MGASPPASSCTTGPLGCSVRLLATSSHQKRKSSAVKGWPSDQRCLADMQREHAPGLGLVGCQDVGNEVQLKVVADQPRMAEDVEQARIRARPTSVRNSPPGLPSSGCRRAHAARRAAAPTPAGHNPELPAPGESPAGSCARSLLAANQLWNRTKCSARPRESGPNRSAACRGPAIAMARNCARSRGREIERAGEIRLRRPAAPW